MDKKLVEEILLRVVLFLIIAIFIILFAVGCNYFFQEQLIMDEAKSQCIAQCIEHNNIHGFSCVC
jgi:hypothetical protein